MIGVVDDAKLEGADQDPSPRFYAPYSQHDQVWQSWLTLIARTSDGTDPGTVHRAMSAALHDLDPWLPPRGLGTVAGAYDRLAARRTFAMTVALAFGLSALLLCVLGLYGLISYSVAARKKEISLRMALGAELFQIAGSVVRSTLELATAGALFGALLALVATRAIESLLFGVSPVDGVTYAGTLLVVLLVALAAASYPAWRAARMNPADALSAE